MGFREKKPAKFFVARFSVKKNSRVFFPNRRRDWRLTAQKHRLILEMLRGGWSVRGTAKALGVGIRTVQRRKEIVDAELREGFAVDAGVSAGDLVEYVETWWNCPEHGRVRYQPCVQCMARGGIDARGTG